MTDKLNDSDCTEELQALVQIIFGEPASKSNSRRMVRLGGVSRLIKSEKALKYSDVFKQQCTKLGRLMTGDLKVTLWIYYASRRPDLDETLILDLMQGLIYENDRQVKERHAYWGLDPENPRAEILVEKIPDVAPQKKPRHKGRGKGEATCGENTPAS
jgi:Holliday junction resolvase RusA-like endonuclease